MFIHFDRIHERDGQTHTQTDTAWRHRPRLHSIARQWEKTDITGEVGALFAISGTTEGRRGGGGRVSVSHRATRCNRRQVRAMALRLTGSTNDRKLNLRVCDDGTSAWDSRRTAYDEWVDGRAAERRAVMLALGRRLDGSDCGRRVDNSIDDCTHGVWTEMRRRRGCTAGQRYVVSLTSRTDSDSRRIDATLVVIDCPSSPTWLTADTTEITMSICFRLPSPTIQRCRQVPALQL